MQKETILKLDKLNVEFPLFGGILQREVNCVHAVKNVSFTVKKGETIGIVGESGSGKSTLGKAILNVLKLTAPDVRVYGEILFNHNNEYLDILKQDRKKTLELRPYIQMIFQDPYSSLNPRMIVKDIIQEPLDIHTNLSKHEKEEKVFWLLDKVGLSKDQALRYPHEFSGGQRQRIGIARSLYFMPKILILDEPTSALDSKNESLILNDIYNLDSKITLIIISHRSNVFEKCNKIYTLKIGKLIQ